MYLEGGGVTPGRQSSHLAGALKHLSKERREDAMAFYQFCREVDDLADDEARSRTERMELLDRWRARIPGDLPDSLDRIVNRYGVDPGLFGEIVAGCASDLEGNRFTTWRELEAYCWRVACAVGLVSIRIFGARDKESENYAVHLGHALQLTNILRDIGEDARMGRVYLPGELLREHGIREEDLLKGRPGPGFVEACRVLAERAHCEFAAAVPPAGDRKCLLAPRIMKALYQKILRKLEKKNFPVLGEPLRLSRVERALIALRVVVFQTD